MTKLCDNFPFTICLQVGKIHGSALFNERTKLNLKYLLTSFSINFDHKLIVGERCVCVCKGDGQMVGSKGSKCLQADFFFGSVCSWFSAAAAVNEKKRRDFFSHKIYFHGTTTTTR